MTKAKGTLIILGIIDISLVIMHYSDYYFLFLKPTGYIIPLIINVIVIAVLAFRSKFSKIGSIIGLFLFAGFILIYSLTIWMMDYHYTKIDSPYDQQSLVIEYRYFALGEITYSYHFYETKLGIIGKQLKDQSISMVIRGSSGADVEEVLGIGTEEWVTDHVVRFFTWEGEQDVYLSSSQTSAEPEDITESMETFINQMEEKDIGQSITTNGNQLTIRYDQASG